MLRSALILSAGLLAALCFACVAVAPPPPPPAALPATVPLGKVGYPVPAMTTCNSDFFINKVQFVPDGFDPSGDPGDPPLPQIGTPINPNSAYAQTLKNAFQLAPTSFRALLCNYITAIYVNGPIACASLASCSGNSWGYRAWKTGATYVAISAGLWNLTCPDGSPYVYHCFEGDLLANLTGWNTSNPPTPQYSNGNSAADTFDMTILAVLAHEVRHVYWYEVTNHDNPGRDYDPNKFCATSPTNNFFSNSWNTPVKKPLMWHRFGGRDNRNFHWSPPQIATIDSDILAADWTDAAIALDQLYQPPQPWPSFFGALSPDEDFVETFKLYVLTNAQSGQIAGEGPLTSLPISFVSGITEDIPNAYGIPDPNNFGAPSSTRKSALAVKARCIGRSLLSFN